MVLFDAKNICAEFSGGFKTGGCDDAVDDDEPFSSLHILVPQGTIFLL